MKPENPFDNDEYVHDDDDSREEAMELHCQLMVVLVALTEYNAKLIRIAAELHDTAPLAAFEILRFHRSQAYFYGKMFDRTAAALEHKAIQYSVEQEEKE